MREAVLAADARRTERRRNGAKKAAVTRASARRRLIFKAATMVAQGQGIRNLSHCYVCGRHLDDPASVERGIGPECWEGVLALVARLIPLTPKADADLRDVQARLFSARPSQPDEQATEPAP